MKEIRLKDDTEIEKLFSAIATDMVSATIHWKLYLDLCDAVEDYEREINETPAFWSLTFDSHRDVTLWRLGRLFDQTNGALSLPNFLETLKQNLEAFEEKPFRKRLSDNSFLDSLAATNRKPRIWDIQKDIQQVSITNTLVKNLVNLRNKHIGHNSAQVALERIPIPNLEVQQVDELLERARKIVNRYSTDFNAKSYSTKIIGEGDYKNVLDAVRTTLKVFDEEIYLN